MNGCGKLIIGANKGGVDVGVLGVHDLITGNLRL